MKKYSLPKEFGEKWVDALRSGEYRQTIGALRDVENKLTYYCANGVAFVANGYELYMATRVIVNGVDISGRYTGLIDTFLFEDIVILNDDKRLSFPEIADWIVENVEFV